MLERRERLGGACTLERPFDDDRFVVSPCAYVVGLLDEVVIDELGLRDRGLRVFVADPNLWVPFEDGTSFGQWLDDEQDPAEPRRARASPKQDIDGYWAYEELFDDVPQAAAQGRPRHLGRRHADAGRDRGDPRTATQEMIDLVFEASIADVLDDHIGDERLKTALFGQGIIGTWGGPCEPGTASIKLMHYQGDLDGQGPVWGYVEGGMGMVSFAIADAAREAGAVLACGVPVAAIHPGEGVELEDGTRLRVRHRDLQRRPEAAASRLLDGSDDRRRLPRAARGLEGPQPGRQVQRRASTACRTGPPRPGEDWPAQATVDVCGSMAGGAGARSSAAPPASPRSASARSTSRPATTRARPPRAST